MDGLMLAHAINPNLMLLGKDVRLTDNVHETPVILTQQWYLPLTPHVKADLILPAQMPQVLPPPV
eukprot:scaffold21764_cov57-Cyclotella_meneghiniana.AAC.1